MKKQLVSLLLCAVLLCALAGYDSLLPKQEQPSARSTVRVTIPEGYSVAQIALKLQEEGVCDAAAFREAANTPLEGSAATAWIAQSDTAADRAFYYEGYLFPDTHEFYLEENPQTVLKRMLAHTATKLSAEDEARAQALGYTVDEILTLASIVQAEASDTKQMAMVASVLHNRLNRDDFARLECDATIFYLQRYVYAYVEQVQQEPLSALYNTYKCKGLPAGPICNPGTAAIQAALYPAESSYVFFVTDSEGNYYYAQTLAEHNANCKKAGLSGY